MAHVNKIHTMRLTVAYNDDFTKANKIPAKIIHNIPRGAEKHGTRAGGPKLNKNLGAPQFPGKQNTFFCKNQINKEPHINSK